MANSRPGATLKCQTPYPGESTLSQFPVGSPPTLGLNIDRCIKMKLSRLLSFSFIIIINNHGPNLLPWGTPARMSPHFLVSPFVYHWLANPKSDE